MIKSSCICKICIPISYHRVRTVDIRRLLQDTACENHREWFWNLTCRSYILFGKEMVKVGLHKLNNAFTTQLLSCSVTPVNTMSLTL